MAAKRKAKAKRKRAAPPRPWSRAYLPERQAAVETLIETYNECLGRIEGKVCTPKAVTLKQLRLFDDIAAFAEWHKIDAQAWIVTVFVHLSWKAIPSEASFFQSKRVAHAEDLASRAYEDVLAVDAAVREANKSTLTDAFVPFRDLSTGAEIAKRNYLARGQAEVCLLNMDITYGFHPGSEQCKVCPIRLACAEKTKEIAAAFVKER